MQTVSDDLQGHDGVGASLAAVPVGRPELPGSSDALRARVLDRREEVYNEDA